MLMKINNEIRGIVKDLLDGGEVELIIGYGKSSLEDKATPVFITKAEEVQKLIFDRTCNLMLAKYLLMCKYKKTGIIAKPCDTRAIVGYIVEKQLKRENLKIIGVSCEGMDGNRACSECRMRNPVLFDYKAGEDIDVSRLNIKESHIKKIEKMTPEERWNYITKEFVSKCIKCYACRQACYLCYCNKCFVDKNQPTWSRKGIQTEDIMTYHIIRAMHTAGRCINCGMCESACPMDIDVRLLSSKLYNDSKEMFGYEAGMDINEKPVITDYNINDSEKNFIK